MTQKKRGYSVEFKQNAVKLADQIGTKEAAVSLNVCKASISIWKKIFNSTEPSSSEDVD